MTTGEILEQTWKLLGEPTDLNPNTSDGRDRLLIGVNQGQKAIATWKDPARGRFFNYNHFRKEIFKKYEPLTGTASSSSDENVVIVDSLPTGETEISGSLIKVNNETRIIYDNSGDSCYVDKPFSNTTSGKSYTLYPRWLYLQSNVRFIEILKVENLDEKMLLQQADFKKDFLNELGNIREPQYFYRVGNRIYFDTVPEDERLFRIWIYRLPKDVSVDTEIPELPESVHFGIVLWAVYWGYQWKQEPRDAYAAQERFKNFMRTVKDEFDVKDEMRDEFDLSVRVQ